MKESGGSEIAPLFSGGQLIEIDNKRPVLIDDPSLVFLVVSGQIELFGQITSTDNHPRESLASIQEGEIFFGLPHQGEGDDRCDVFATGVFGTRVIAWSWQQIQDDLRGDESCRRAFATLIDRWIDQLGQALSEAAGHQKIDVKLSRGREYEVKTGDHVGASDSVVWLNLEDGLGFLLGLEPVGGDDGWLPIGGGVWIASEFEGRIRPGGTMDLMEDPARIYPGLCAYNDAFAKFLLISKELYSIDEAQRQNRRVEYRQAARNDALGKLVDVIEPGKGQMLGGIGGDPGDSLMSACMAVGAEMGIEIRRHQDLDRAKDLQTKLGLIAKASRIRLRQVILEGPWWERDQGPLLAFRRGDNQPVALLPISPGAYELHDSSLGTIEPVTKEVAATLSPFATSMYRTFESGEVDAKRFLRFGVFGLGGEFLLVGVMSVAVGLLGMLTPIFTAKIFDQVIPSADTQMMWQYIAALLSAAIATGAFHAVRGLGILRVEGKMDYAAQSAIWSRMLDLPSGFFRRYAAGDLAERAYAVDSIREIISNGAVTAILGSSVGIFQGIIMFKINMKLAAIGLGLIALMMLTVTLANYFQLKFQRKEYAVRGVIAGLALQLLTGVSKIRVAAAEDHAFRLWAQQFASQKRIGFVIGRIQNFVEVFNGGFPVLCSVVLFGFFAQSLQQGEAAGGGGISTGQFIAFNTAFTMTLTAMTSLGMVSLQLLEIVPIFERVKPVLTEEPEVTDEGRHPGELTGDLELYHVSFRYSEDGPLIIKNVDLKVRRGEFIAFVGPSGSGKSTLLRLLLGFETPEAGYIYFDGQDLGTLDLREVRKQMGVVLQTSQLLPTTIYQNIIGASTSLTLGDAWDAAILSGLDKDIESMPMGMHTVVSEGGGGFSGGQKQRLMIARALVHRPRIVFFDEATSALDNRTQRIVTESLDRMDATRIVVAHRLSTIVDADRIVVLKDGEVVEVGNYTELMEMGGVFYDLAQRQQM